MLVICIKNNYFITKEDYNIEYTFEATHSSLPSCHSDVNGFVIHN